MKTHAWLLAALAVAAFATTAGAQPFGQQGYGRGGQGYGRGGPPIERPMLRADANGDGVVSPQERTAFQARPGYGALCPFASGQRPAGAGYGRIR